MKYLLFILLSFSQAVFSQTLSEFSLLSDNDKMDLIYNGDLDEIFDTSELNEFVTDEMRSQVDLLANSLVDVWGDTVLEGPYAIVQVDLSISIDSVYIKNGQVYAIRGYVSNPAIIIESDDCEYDYESSTYTEECYEGFISQSFYMDINGVEIDSDSYADFDS